MTTSLQSSRRQHDTEMHARRFANVMLSMLDEFIPRHSQREAAYKLFMTALDQGFELNSKAMREQYEAVTLQAAQLTAFSTMPAPCVKDNAD